MVLCEGRKVAPSSSSPDVQPVVNTGELDSLLQEACGGSSDARGRVLETCRAFLLLVANEELAPDVRAKGSASDLVQESFLEAERDFGGFHGRTHDDLVVWLRGILLHNVADFHDRYRRTGKRCVRRETSLDGVNSVGIPFQNLASADPTPSWLAWLSEQERLVREAVSRLPPDYGRVILLRHYEHLTFVSIAAKMNRSSEAVRMLWRRAIGQLERDLRNAR
jgi:RNA polymerase sigma-70 factor, ECF subfamily